MFEFHAWINIKSTGSDDPKTIKDSVYGVPAIRQSIEHKKDPKTKFEIFYQQGKPYLRLDGCLEHYHGWVLEMFSQVAKMANSSEGMLFIRDDENPFLDSQYRVWQMTEGQVCSGEMTFFPDQFNDSRSSYLQAV